MNLVELILAAIGFIMASVIVGSLSMVVLGIFGSLNTLNRFRKKRGV